jgi:hypothetical protein
MSASSWVDRAPARFLFRFCCAFLLLYNFPFPLNFVPGVDVDAPMQAAWDKLVRPAGRALFGVTPTSAFGGSGDTRWYFAQLALIIAISLAAALLWTIWDRRTNYPLVARWLHVYVRFALAAVMLGYGAAKVIPTQFPAPTLDRLTQPFGQASPMGLLWTFMGASAPYVILTGLAEMLGGLLLTMRRTALVGALVSAGVVTQVVVLNFCYDVPVKLFSSFLLFEALFLIAYDARRLLFALLPPVPRTAWWKPVLRTAIVIAFCAMLLQQTLALHRQLSERSPLRGVWRVDTLQVNGVERLPLITDATRWRRLVFDFPQGMSIQLMDDRRHRYGITLEGARSFSVRKRDAPSFRGSFTYTRPDAGTLIVDGVMESERIHAVTHREPDAEYLLTTRGFHWINETPFNR